MISASTIDGDKTTDDDEKSHIVAVLLLQLAGILYFALPGSVRRGFLHTGSLKVVYFNTKNSTATESDLILLMEGSEFAFKVVFIFCGSNIFATIDNTGCTEDKRDL